MINDIDTSMRPPHTAISHNQSMRIPFTPNTRNTTNNSNTINIPSFDTDYPSVDRSGLMKSAHHVIELRLANTRSKLQCLQSLEPEKDIVPYMEDFQGHKQSVGEYGKEFWLQAISTLNVWRYVNHIPPYPK
jgi:hypothetical protein